MWCRDLRLSLPQTDNTPGASRQNGACARSTSRSSASRSSAFAFLGRSPIPWAVSSHSSAQELALFQPPGFCSSRINLIKSLQHVYHCAIIWLRGRQAEPSSVSGERNQDPYREKEMSNPIVFGFPRSTFVQIVRLVLTHKNVTYTFHDLEPEMGKPTHLALHPFNRVPILRHGDFTVYETSAIVSYLEESFPKPALQPKIGR